MTSIKKKQLLTEASEAKDGTAAVVIYNGEDFTQTLIAIEGAKELPTHAHANETTIYVLEGAVNLLWDEGKQGEGLEKGDLAVVPQEDHSIQATLDSVILVTGAK